MSLLLVVGVLGILAIVAFAVVLLRERAAQLPKLQLDKLPTVASPDMEKVTQAGKQMVLFPLKVAGVILGLMWKLILLALVIIAIYGVVTIVSPLEFPGKERIESLFSGSGSEYSVEKVLKVCNKSKACSYKKLSFSGVVSEKFDIDDKKIYFINMSSSTIQTTMANRNNKVMALFTLEPDGHIDGGVEKPIDFSDTDIPLVITFEAEVPVVVYVLLIDYNNQEFFKKVGY